jgi:hypothetical protein
VLIISVGVPFLIDGQGCGYVWCAPPGRLVVVDYGLFEAKVMSIGTKVVGGKQYPQCTLVIDYAYSITKG